MDHHPLAVLDELVLLSQVDQVSQLGLGCERPVPEALARRERVADQDQQLGQRAEHARQRVDEAGSNEGDRWCVLTPQGPRRHAHRDVGHDDHRDAGNQDRLPEAVEAGEGDRRHEHGREQLAADPEQREQVEVASRVGNDLREPGGAAAPLALEALSDDP